MPRRYVACIALAVVVAAIAIARFAVSGGVRPIEEYDRVYYSSPERNAAFYDELAPEDVGWVLLPQPGREGAFRSHGDPALQGFVRPQVCAECHPEKYEGLKGTAHYRTSSEASLETILGEFGGKRGRLETRDPHLHFEMVADAERLRQCVIVQSRGEVYRHCQPFDLVVGSGNHGQSYLYWRGDELYQLPVSYFSESDSWINSPGLYRDGTADFARGIAHRCLDCHATFFAAAPGADIRYDREKYILGVTCVRCHGAGWAHVQYHRTHPRDASPRYIVHPGKLPRDRANEVCAQCHSGVGTLLGPAFAYHPGDPLDAHLHLEAGVDDPTNDDPHAANQLARLMRSRCFQESESLTCAVCHDPHRQERGDLKTFALRCGKCHQSGDCTAPGTSQAPLKDYCIECHMPSRRDFQSMMQTSEGELLPLLRDHLIQVWPEVAEQVRERVASD
ncbi:MAG: cytochrome c family protein [Planctomycetes bacterium]|nr:cytochrome c family protein [Planctomycetota bacterium]